MMELFRKGDHQVLRSQRSGVSSDGPYRIFVIGDMAYQEVVAVVKQGDDVSNTVWACPFVHKTVQFVLDAVFLYGCSH